MFFSNLTKRTKADDSYKLPNIKVPAKNKKQSSGFNKASSKPVVTESHVPISVSTNLAKNPNRESYSTQTISSKAKENQKIVFAKVTSKKPVSKASLLNTYTKLPPLPTKKKVKSIRREIKLPPIKASIAPVLKVLPIIDKETPIINEEIPIIDEEIPITPVECVMDLSELAMKAIIQRSFKDAISAGWHVVNHEKDISIYINKIDKIEPYIPIKMLNPPTELNQDNQILNIRETKTLLNTNLYDLNNYILENELNNLTTPIYPFTVHTSLPSSIDNRKGYIEPILEELKDNIITCKNNVDSLVAEYAANGANDSYNKVALDTAMSATNTLLIEHALMLHSLNKLEKAKDSLDKTTTVILTLKPL